jgi:hypothetical protein
MAIAASEARSAMLAGHAARQVRHRPLPAHHQKADRLAASVHRLAVGGADTGQLSDAL